MTDDEIPLVSDKNFRKRKLPDLTPKEDLDHDKEASGSEKTKQDDDREGRGTLESHKHSVPRPPEPSHPPSKSSDITEQQSMESDSSSLPLSTRVVSPDADIEIADSVEEDSSTLDEKNMESSPLPMRTMLESSEKQCRVKEAREGPYLQEEIPNDISTEDIDNTGIVSTGASDPDNPTLPSDCTNPNRQDMRKKPEPSSKERQTAITCNEEGNVPPMFNTAAPTDTCCLKAPPLYSLEPELMVKLKNEPLKPEQRASQLYIEKFLRGKLKLERSRRGVSLDRPPTLTQRASIRAGQALRTTSHDFEEHFGPRSRFSLDGQYDMWIGNSSHHHHYRRRNYDINQYEDNVNCSHTSHSKTFTPGFTTNPLTPPQTPPSGRHVQGERQSSMPARGPPSPPQKGSEPAPSPRRRPNFSPSSTTGVFTNSRSEDLNVSIAEITNDGKGQEWTCVFSGVAQSDIGLPVEISLEENFQRLVGHRILFGGSNQGLKTNEIGNIALILPATDFYTRTITATSKMVGILERKGDISSSHPESDIDSVLCYGWQPNDDGPVEDYGLEDYWSELVWGMDPSEQKFQSVDVTIEGHTGKNYYPWSESFPYGDLFGMGDSVNRDQLEKRYWKVGIVVTFHWDGEVLPSESGGYMVKEFALFVPSSSVHAGDATIDASVVTLNDAKLRAS